MWRRPAALNTKEIVLLSSKCSTMTAKPGRNDPCPCGSGNKYKKCCLTKNDAAELVQHVEAEASALSVPRRIASMCAS